MTKENDKLSLALELVLSLSKRLPFSHCNGRSFSLDESKENGRIDDLPLFWSRDLAGFLKMVGAFVGSVRIRFLIAIRTKTTNKGTVFLKLS